mgnify:CR=1 FL=1
MSADPASVSANDLTQLRGVGPALAEKLGKLGVFVQQDLLFVLPFRYEDRTRIVPIGGLLPGQRVVVEAEIELTEVVYRRRRTMMCTISDGTGTLTLRFFYFSRAQQKGLARGRRLRCYGEVRKGPGGLEMVHPEYRLLSDAEQGALEEHLTPIYPATEGVQQARIRNLIGQLLDNPAHKIDEILPADVRSKHELAPLDAAVRYLHRPPQDADAGALIAGTHPAQQRLALEEMLAHHLSLRQIRERANEDHAVPLKARDDLVGRFIEGLGFTLTGDQQSALKTISRDLEADAVVAM